MNSIIEHLPFFKDKNKDFQMRVLPLLRAKKAFEGDILFSESDIADEIIFVIKGSFTLFKDISVQIELPRDFDK